MYMKVSPMKGVMRLGKKGKLSYKYTFRYWLSNSIGNVAYHLALPSVATDHPIFHFSMLRKCTGDPSLIAPTEKIVIKYNQSYEELPLRYFIARSQVENQKRLHQSRSYGGNSWLRKLLGRLRRSLRRYNCISFLKDKFQM